MESLGPYLCSDISPAPVAGEGRYHLSCELTTEVTVEDTRDSKHRKHMTAGQEEMSESGNKKRNGRREIAQMQ